MSASPTTLVRVAAGIVCAVSVPLVLLHLLRAIGITAEFKELFGGPTDASIGLTFASLIGAAAGAVVTSSRSLASAGTTHDSPASCTSVRGSRSLGWRSGL